MTGQTRQFCPLVLQLGKAFEDNIDRQGKTH